MLRLLRALALVPFLVGQAAAEDCLPVPTAACLQGIAVDALISDLQAIAGLPDDTERLIAWGDLDRTLEEYLVRLVQTDNRLAAARIVRAIPPDRLPGLSMGLVLAEPSLADMAPIGEAARSAAMASSIFDPEGYQTFKTANALLRALGETGHARAIALAAAEDFFVLQSRNPDDKLYAEEGTVVEVLLSLGELSAAEDFLKRAEPAFENASQWMALAKAQAQNGDCGSAMTLTGRVPQSERERIGSSLLEVIHQCRGLEAAILESGSMPEQELGMLAMGLVSLGKIDDAVRIAEVMRARQSWWEYGILRDVARAQMEAGEYNAVLEGLSGQSVDPYESARTRIELVLAMAKAGQDDIRLLEQGILDIRAIDPMYVDPFAMADLMVLAGFAQTWFDDVGPEFLSLDEIEAQVLRLSPADRSDLIGQLDAMEEGPLLRMALVALAKAMGQKERADAFKRATLQESCGGSDEQQADCLLMEAMFIAQNAPPGRIGDLPSRAWSFASRLTDPVSRGQWAWWISISLEPQADRRRVNPSGP